MSLPPIDCLCVGIIVADHVCTPISHFPAGGGLVLSERMELTLGGCASNVALDLAKLDHSVRLAGCVGEDVFGRFIREFMQAENVDCELVAESPTHATSASFVVNVEGEDRRFIHSVGANGAFTADSITEAHIAAARVVYVGGFGLLEGLTADRVLRLFRAAHESGAHTVLDVVNSPDAKKDREAVFKVLPETDLFCPNDDEGRYLTGEADPQVQAKIFQETGAKSVIITCGGEGVHYRDQTQLLQGPAYPVELVDGTGSGDAFVAGYIHGLLQAGDVRHCLALGSALGASAVRQAGSTTGIFNATELESYVDSHPLPLTELIE